MSDRDESEPAGSDRGDDLRALADEIADRDGVADAWLAKSFTDRLFVVEVPEDEELPASVTATLDEYGLVGSDEVYDVDGAADAGFAGDLDDAHRYRFVDVESRGELQSYVVE